MPSVASCALTTEAPAAEQPAMPKRAPSPLSNISANRLSEGVLVSAMRSARVGEETLAIAVAHRRA